MSVAGGAPSITKAEELLIDRIARKTAARLVASPESVSIAGTGVDREDLVMEARIACLRALRNYDATRGTALVSWLVSAARGAVLEGLRQADILSRRERRCYREAHAEGGTAPRPRTLISYEELAREEWDSESGEWHSRQAPLAVPDAALSALPDRDAIERAFLALPGRVSPAARLVAEWYVRERRPLKECAALLKLSESRAHQLMAQARTVLIPALQGEPLGEPAPKRKDKAWIGPFLFAVRRGCLHYIAAALAGIAPGSPYHHARRDSEFAQKWVRARIAAGKREPHLWREPFLALVRQGKSRQIAAKECGISTHTPRGTAWRDPLFSAAWEAARKAGRERRSR